MSGLTLFSVGALVVTVSLSLLGEVAAHENERDALHTLRALRAAMVEPGATRASLPELARSRPEAFESLEDHRWIGGGLLLRHGYLFRAEASEGSGTVLSAWPWAHGRTGFASFAAVVGGAIWAHPGDEAWSGLGGAPELADRTWRRLEAPPR